jgi:methionyl-tRNA synthetase
LFSRIDDQVIEIQINKLKAEVTQETTMENPIKPEITYDDFIKMDLRTAVVLECTKVPKADKLLQLTLDLGFEKRTVVSGIAEHFSPDEVIGKRVTLLANLVPRKIRGVESRGMILMAESEDGLSFVSCPEDMGPGMTIS